ncbi:MAG: hypothetical protein QXI27_05720 [Nitrososphaerota archaeon]
MRSVNEILFGVVFRAPSIRGEELIKLLENDPGIRLVYVRRAPADRYLLIIEAERREGKSECKKHLSF